MADLVTHAASAILVKAATGWRLPAVFVLGTLAPDMFCRVPSIVLGGIHNYVTELPPVVTHIWQPLHQPAGMVLLAYALCLFFQESTRKAVFFNLLGGMGLHLVLDMLQDHHGAGYQLLFPFSTHAVEWGLMGSESTVYWAIPLAMLAVLVTRKRLKRETPGAF